MDDGQRGRENRGEMPCFGRGREVCKVAVAPRWGTTSDRRNCEDWIFPRWGIRTPFPWLSQRAERLGLRSLFCIAASQHFVRFEDAIACVKTKSTREGRGRRGRETGGASCSFVHAHAPASTDTVYLRAAGHDGLDNVGGPREDSRKGVGCDEAATQPSQGALRLERRLYCILSRTSHIVFGCVVG